MEEKHMTPEAKTTEKSPTTSAKRPAGMVALEDLDRWFEDLFPRRWLHPFVDRASWPSLSELKAPFAGHWPKTDIIDHDHEVVVRAELPGVKKEDLEVSVTDRSVTLRATTKHEEKEEKGDYIRRELSSGEYHRTLALPDDVKADAAKAVFKDGILELTLPKVESAKRKSIKVE
jgi:HSP20 family protein